MKRLEFVLKFLRNIVFYDVHTLYSIGRVFIYPKLKLSNGELLATCFALILFQLCRKDYLFAVFVINKTRHEICGKKYVCESCDYTRNIIAHVVYLQNRSDYHVVTLIFATKIHSSNIVQVQKPMNRLCRKVILSSLYTRDIVFVEKSACKEISKHTFRLNKVHIINVSWAELFIFSIPHRLCSLTRLELNINYLLLHFSSINWSQINSHWYSMKQTRAFVYKRLFIRWPISMNISNSLVNKLARTNIERASIFYEHMWTFDRLFVHIRTVVRWQLYWYGQ